MTGTIAPVVACYFWGILVFKGLAILERGQAVHFGGGMEDKKSGSIGSRLRGESGPTRELLLEVILMRFQSLPSISIGSFEALKKVFVAGLIGVAVRWSLFQWRLSDAGL